MSLCVFYCTWCRSAAGVTTLWSFFRRGEMISIGRMTMSLLDTVLKMKCCCLFSSFLLLHFHINFTSALGSFYLANVDGWAVPAWKKSRILKSGWSCLPQRLNRQSSQLAVYQHPSVVGYVLEMESLAAVIAAFPSPSDINSVCF